MGKGVLTVYQEDWFPFQALPAALEERPFSAAGIAACEAVGDAVNAAITGAETAETALARIETDLTRLIDAISKETP